jgi:hypothetical protein
MSRWERVQAGKPSQTRELQTKPEIERDDDPIMLSVVVQA